MFENTTLVIQDWYRHTSDRQKLQHFYVALLCVAVIVAGVSALFNNNPSAWLVTFAKVIAISFIVNLLAWSVLSSIILEKLRRQQRPARFSSARQ
jgi:predicted lysophospholipase L1 biosynthesis ABC-type transport system permease subunit